MRLLLLTAFFAITLFAKAQKEIKDTLYSETFQKKSEWPQFKTTTNSTNGEVATASAKIEQGRYVFLQMGDTGSMILVPPKLAELSTKLQQDYEIVFDYGLEGYPDKVTQIGLIWDLHDVSAECSEGKFYKLNFISDPKERYMTVQLAQRSECNGNNDPVADTKIKVALQKRNKIRLRMSRSFYMVSINNQQVLGFNFEGRFNLSAIYHSGGVQYLDNIQLNRIAYQSYFPKPGVPQNDQPKVYILMAGIEIYDHPENTYRDLKVCLDDVDSMYKFWSSNKGGRIPESQFKSFKGAEATTLNLVAAASEIVATATKNDYVIFYFAGHGDPSGFIAYDSLLPYEKLNALTRYSPAKKLYIVDACYSGSWNTSFTLAENGQKLSDTAFHEAVNKRFIGMNANASWFLSCQPDELSFEGISNGNFTCFLLEALTGKADLNNNLQIDLSEAYYYMYQKFEQWNKEHQNEYELVYDRVAQNNIRIPKKQHPKLISENASMPLSTIVD